MTLTRITPLDGGSIISLAHCKAHLRVANTSEDDVIAALRDAAIGHVERVSGIAMAPTEYRWTIRQFSPRITLPVGPVTEIASIVYHDGAGAEIEYNGPRLIAGEVYPVAGGSWPTAYGHVAVTFTAGLQDITVAPELITAAKLQLEVLNDRGRSAPDVIRAREKAVEALIGTYRAILV